MASDQNPDDSSKATFEKGEGAAPTLLCPNGHINAWNYKFCGECGAPIGIVAWPDEDSNDAPADRRRLTPTVIALAVTAVLVVAVLVVGIVRLAVSEESPRTPAAPAVEPTSAAATTTTVTETSCSSAPLLSVDSFDLTAAGLEIGAAFISPCGDDVESNSALVITAAEGQRDVAAASFDFSADPLALKANTPVHRTLVFPSGMYWRTPDMLSGAPELLAKRTGTETSPQPTGSREPLVMAASASAEPEHGSVTGVAGAVLEELRSSDLSDVQSYLSNSWVPQIGSKYVGLKWEGITWGNADILRDHLAFRYRFSSARLVWSGDWTTFDGPIYWVTVVGPSYRTPTQANSWCNAQGFAADDCFAKFISSLPMLAGYPGTTVYRR